MAITAVTMVLCNKTITKVNQFFLFFILHSINEKFTVFLLVLFVGYDTNAQPIQSSPEHTNNGFIVNTDQPPVIPTNYHAQVAQLAHYADDINDEHGNENQAYKRNTKKRQSNKLRKRARNSKAKTTTAAAITATEQEHKPNDEQHTQA